MKFLIFLLLLFHHAAFVEYPKLGTVRHGHVIKSETNRLL